MNDSTPNDPPQQAKSQRITILTPESADTIRADVFDIHIEEVVVQQYPIWKWPTKQGRIIKKRGPLVDTMWYVTTGRAIIDGEVCEVVQTLPGFWRKCNVEIN